MIHKSAAWPLARDEGVWYMSGAAEIASGRARELERHRRLRAAVGGVHHRLSRYNTPQFSAGLVPGHAKASAHQAQAVRLSTGRKTGLGSAAIVIESQDLLGGRRKDLRFVDVAGAKGVRGARAHGTARRRSVSGP